MQNFAAVKFGCVCLLLVVFCHAPPSFAGDSDDFFAKRHSVETKLLQILERATFARKNKHVGNLDELPRLSRSFICRGFRTLNGNKADWKSKDEPRDDVLTYLALSVVAALKDRGGIPIRLHEELGQCIGDLLERLADDRLRERRLVDLMNHGSFWTPAQLGFVLDRLEKRGVELYGAPVLAVSSDLSSADKARVRQALLARGPQVLEYSLLLLLGAAEFNDKVELVSGFAEAYARTVNHTYLQFFPVGRFGDALNSPDLSVLSEEIAKAGERRPLPGQRLSMISQITTSALAEIHRHYVRWDDPSVVAAIGEAMGRLPFSPSFFLKLTTTGFMEITPPRFNAKPVYDPHSQVIIFPRFRNMRSCEDNLK